VQLFPRQGGIVGKGFYLVQLLFPRQIVAYIVIKNLCLARVSRFLDEQGDGKGVREPEPKILPPSLRDSSPDVR